MQELVMVCNSKRAMVELDSLSSTTLHQWQHLHLQWDNSSSSRFNLNKFQVELPRQGLV